MKRLTAFFTALCLFMAFSAPFCLFFDTSAYAASMKKEKSEPLSPEITPEPDEYETDLDENNTSSYDVLSFMDEDEYVTRAQAVYMLILFLADEVKAVTSADLSSFSDYYLVEPYYEYSLGAAVSLGIINGSDDNCLCPNDYITRIEAFVMMSRVLSQDELGGDEGDLFYDVPDWAESDIRRLKGAGLIYGYGDGTLGSYDFMTITQLRVLYLRLIEYQNSLPGGGLYKDDFYSYVNEQWLAETSLPEGYARWSNIEQISQSNAYRIQKIIGEIITDYYVGKDIEDGSNKQKILDVYKAAANVKYRDQIGLKPIEPYLDKIDKVRDINEFVSVMAELETLGIHTLLPITVNNDFKNSSKYTLTFEGSYTGLSVEVIKNDEHKKTINLYNDYIRSLFAISGQSNREAEENADAVTALCTKLGRASIEREEWDNLADIYNVYENDKACELFSSIDFEKYLSSLGYTNPERIVVFDEHLAEVINRVLSDTSLKTLKNYLKAALLDYSSLYLNSDTFKAYQTYIDGMSGTKSDLTPDAYAVTITQSILPMEIGEEYIARYFSSDSKKEIELLADEIVKTFEKRLMNLTWLGDETKKYAIEKLESISVRIGYPDYLTDYKNNDFNVKSIDDGGSLMEYILSYNKLSSENDAYIINRDIPVNKENWTMSPQTVNAYYDRASNCIVIPAGILQAPYYSPNASHEANLGGIGSVIAHEITHAFDNVGSQFDKNGNLNDWWTAEDFAAFNEICEKFVLEYDKIEIFDGYYVNGKMTLSENIADIGAMACILDIAGKDNPNLSELFTSYARTYRSVLTDEYSKMLLLTDEHSPNIVRVNMVLSNFEEFLSLYNIKNGDKMYKAPNDRLAIW